MMRLPQRVILRSDDGQDPDVHRRAAIVHLGRMRSLADQLYDAANRYHSAVGHLAEVDLEAPATPERQAAGSPVVPPEIGRDRF